MTAPQSPPAGGTLAERIAGLSLTSPEPRPVTGMPGASGRGFVDYVLRGADGRPLALLEAKRTRVDPRAGQQQAKLYADALERQYGQRPLIFLSNGYDHWIWDDTRYPPRPIQGFLKRDKLASIISIPDLISALLLHSGRARGSHVNDGSRSAGQIC